MASTLTPTRISGSDAQPKRVAIIGAGWAGLVAAKTYLQINPSIHLTIYDTQRTLGGVWSQARCFPGFIADSPSGLFDFSDLPMREATDVRDWDDLESVKVYEYLDAYARKFGLLERLRLGVKVEGVRREERVLVDGDGEEEGVGEGKEGWVLSLRAVREGEGDGGEGAKSSGYEEADLETVTCDKLILATGLNSNPYWPPIPRSTFTGKILHSTSIGLNHAYLTSSIPKRVVVYGGCKSAVDALILLTSSPSPTPLHIDWVIRPSGSGNGPGVMVELRPFLGIHGARLAGRWKDVLTPSVFRVGGGGGWWDRFLHGGTSAVGNWLFGRMWRAAGTVPLGKETYRSRNGEMLRPEIEDALFFTAGLSGLHGNKTFLDALASGRNLTVHRASITSMSGTDIHLSNDTALAGIDTAIFATGWDPTSTSRLFGPSDALLVGLPAPLTAEAPASAQHWADLHSRADSEVVAALPALAHPPPHFQREVDTTPWRLYRYMVPPTLAAQGDTSIVFLGQVVNVQTSILSEVGALWCVAYMEGLVDVCKRKSKSKSKEEMEYEIAKVQAWSQRRYLGRGKTRQVCSAEVGDVVNVLMGDLGLKVERKGSWWREMLVPRTAQDYKGIVGELLEVVERREREKERGGD